MADRMYSMPPDNPPFSSTRRRAATSFLFRIVGNTEPLPAFWNYENLKEFYLSKDQKSLEIQVLYIKRSIRRRDRHSGQIALPGGHVDPGETSLEAAVREVREELGLKLDDKFMHLGSLPEYNCYNL